MLFLCGTRRDIVRLLRQFERWRRKPRPPERRTPALLPSPRLSCPDCSGPASRDPDPSSAACAPHHGAGSPASERSRARRRWSRPQGRACGRESRTARASVARNVFLGGLFRAIPGYSGPKRARLSAKRAVHRHPTAALSAMFSHPSSAGARRRGRCRSRTAWRDSGTAAATCAPHHGAGYARCGYRRVCG